MEKIRLQKYMADAGIMSRRAAEEEIKKRQRFRKRTRCLTRYEGRSESG